MSMAHGAVTIVTSPTTVTLITPYNPGLPARARTLGGKWNAAQKAWIFDARDEDLVRELAHDLFGTDGTSDLDDLVTVTVTLASTSASPQFTVAGRIVAERRGRDLPVRLADGVIVRAGTLATSGGSVRHPAIDSDGVVLEIRDIPRTAAHRFGLDIVDGITDRRSQLETERTQLLARLAQIEQELG